MPFDITGNKVNGIFYIGFLRISLGLRKKSFPSMQK